MASKYKLTAMELGALSVLTLVIAAIAVTLTVRNCHGDKGDVNIAACDSITKRIESKLAASDTMRMDEKASGRKAKQIKNKKSGRKEPKQRNYLDETVNE